MLLEFFFCYPVTTQAPMFDQTLLFGQTPPFDQTRMFDQTPLFGQTQMFDQALLFDQTLMFDQDRPAQSSFKKFQPKFLLPLPLPLLFYINTTITTN